MADKILVHLEKGKEKKAEFTLVDDKIELIRVYDRGKDALGFNGLYAWLYEQIKLSKSLVGNDNINEIIKRMKWLNSTYPGCHPISLSINDLKNLLPNYDPTIKFKPVLKELVNYKLMDLELDEDDLKDDPKYQKLFNGHLKDDGKLKGWLNEKKYELKVQCRGQSRKFPCKSIYDEATRAPYNVLMPSMIERAYNGGVVANTRTLMDAETDNVNNIDGTTYSLGDYGWVVMGFDCGFNSNRMNEIRMTEDQTGEWVDIWVYRNKLPFDHMVDIPRDANLFPVYQVTRTVTPAVGYKLKKVAGRLGGGRRFTCRDNKPTGGKNQLIPKRRDWTKFTFSATDDERKESNQIDDVTRTTLELEEGDFVCTDAIPMDWLFVGTVVGSGNNPELKSRPGPHLGNLPKGKYHHLLIVDAMSYGTGAGGPEIVQLGVTMLDNVNFKDGGYYMLIIDDSASLDGGKTKYIEEANKQVLKWMETDKVEKKFLGIRLIRWKTYDKDGNLIVTPPAWATATSTLTYVEKYKLEAVKTPREEFTYRIPLKKSNSTLPSNKFADTYFTTDGLWVKIKLSDKVRIKKFITSLLTQELRMTNVKINASCGYTPLVESLDDLIDIDIKKDLVKDTTVNRYPVKVAVLSDGQPDPLYQISTQDASKTNIYKKYNNTDSVYKTIMSYILATNPEGKNFNDIVAKPPTLSLLDSSLSKQYTVEGKLKILSEITINSVVNLLSKVKRIDLEGGGKEILWTTRIYKSPRMEGYINLIDIDSEDAKINQNTILDHSRLPHTDCNRGVDTTVRIGPCCKSGL